MQISGKIKTIVILLGVAALACGSALAWAIEKSWAIGVNASDTGGNGGSDQILWLWLFLALAGTAASLLCLIIIVSRLRTHR